MNERLGSAQRGWRMPTPTDLKAPETREAELKRWSGGRLTAPDIQRRKLADPIVALTACSTRMAELLDPHCDMLLVGDTVGQVIYGPAHHPAGHA